MGCVTSTKKIVDNDVFRVRCLRIQPANSSMGRYGFLEITKKELVFIQQGNRGNVIWALQHLRRFGLHEDVFSFEAGRRCPGGPGIYTFRCTQNAERLYQIFQRNVNAVSSVTNEEMFGSRSYEHPSQTFGRLEPTPHSNNYLEPAPTSSAPVHRIQESFSSSPLSVIDSPDSVHSLSFTNEIVHFPNSQNNHNTVTPSGAPFYSNNSALNLYSENPLSSCISTTSKIRKHTQRFFGSESANSTLQRPTFMKHTSIDAPKECAPLPPSSAGISESNHNYANVEVSKSYEKILDSSEPCDTTERCYENLNRLELCLPLFINNLSDKNESESDHQSQTGNILSGVNYIVLDLDYPRSPTQSSLKTFGSGFSLALGEGPEVNDMQYPPHTAPITDESQDFQQNLQREHQKQETALGYSTIDFIKTFALVKSSTHGADFGLDTEHDSEDLRITRHSTCVRKAYSISE